MFIRAHRAIRAHGLQEFCRKATRRIFRIMIRPCLPGRQNALYAGIAVPVRRKLGDEYFRIEADKPQYEASLIKGLNARVRCGDRVIVIGGGIGVTAVIAAELSSPGGSVLCFEASDSQVKQICQTLALNRCQAFVEVLHRIVGQNVHAYGATGSAEVMDAASLPDCDVLEMDCEGAERVIIKSMKIRPRIVLVETHGIFGAPTTLIRSELERMGYIVRDLGIAEPTLSEFCEASDIRVLEGVLSGH